MVGVMMMLLVFVDLMIDSEIFRFVFIEIEIFFWINVLELFSNVSNI